MVVVTAVGGLAYTITLRTRYTAQWRDLVRAFRRLVPERQLRAAVRRLPVDAGRSAS